jgi:hypothetical protein
MKITKAKLKQIIKEELKSILNERGGFSVRRAAEIGAQMSMANRKAPVDHYTANIEEEMAAYLIGKGVYRANPGGTVDVFTGTTGAARSSLKNSGKFTDEDIRTYINKLDKQIR